MKTVYLGQYTDDVANLIAAELEEASIGWSYKQASRLTRIFFMGEWGTRMFVESSRLEEALAIAERVLQRASSRGDR